MCTGLRKFPDDVLDRLTFGQAVELAEFWGKHPSLIHSGGGFGIGPAPSGRQVQQPFKPSSRAEVDALLSQYGQQPNKPPKVN